MLIRRIKKPGQGRLLIKIRINTIIGEEGGRREGGRGGKAVVAKQTIGSTFKLQQVVTHCGFGKQLHCEC